MIQPQPFKFVCPKCGYSSDALNPIDMINICSKCEAKMERKELSAFDNIQSIFK